MTPDQHVDATPPPRRPPPETREVDSRSLLRGARMVVIRHGHEAYRLSQTAAGKLILTK